jgi:hypothetical protein
MKEEPIFIDGLLGVGYMQEMRRRFGVTSNCWAWIEDTCFDGTRDKMVAPEGMIIKEVGCLTNTIYNRSQERIIESEYDFLMHSTYSLEAAMKKQIMRLDRMKVNLYLPQTMDGAREDVIFTPHQDSEILTDNAYTALINYSEAEHVAPTYLYNIESKGGKYHMSVAHKIYLKPGDCVIYPSYWYHSSSHCNKYRQNINIIFNTGDQSWAK